MGAARSCKNYAIRGIVISNRVFFPVKYKLEKSHSDERLFFLPLYQGKLRIWPIALHTIGKYRFLFSEYAAIIKVVHMQTTSTLF